MVQTPKLGTTNRGTNSNIHAVTPKSRTTNEVVEVPDTEADTATEEGIDTYTYYMEIIYTETNLLNAKEGNFNPENKFVYFDNNKTKLNKSYSDYQLVVGDADEDK